MIARHPPSIIHYALLLAAITLIIIFVFGLYTWYKVDQLRGEIHAGSQAAGQQELATALERVQTQSIQQALRFAEWEEVRQQLRTPEFYGHWKNHRMHQASILSKRVQDAHIYDARGVALSGGGTRQLPPDVAVPPPSAHATQGENEPSLIIFKPIPAAEPDQAPIGFVGIQSRFVNALREGHTYHHVDLESIRFDFQDRTTIPAEDLLSHARFDLRANPLADQVKDRLSVAALNLGTLLSATTLALFASLAYLIVRPLRAIASHVDHLRESSGEIELKRPGGLLPVAETEKIRESLNSYQARLQDVHSNLEARNREFWRMAHHDALTGVHNRRAFEEQWETLPNLAARQGVPVCFVLFDINQFKAINDSYGHQVGDAVLQTVARSIDEVLRDGEHLFRLGGDEFATILMDCDEAGALRLAERCQEKIRDTDFTTCGVHEPVKVSIGLAVTHGTDREALRSLQWQADVAMYKAKRPSTPQVVLFSREQLKDTRGLYSNWINNAVIEAITHERGVQMVYQPVVSLNHRHTPYFEALLRIQHRDEIIGPADIFPLVTARRLELDLDKAILHCILHDLHAHRIPPGAGVSINVSGPTIVHAQLTEWLAPFVPFLQDRDIILEVTETALITEITRATENLRTLRQQGFLIALDDFGSGYSSFRYIASMPVDTVKFDISLIRSLETPGQHHIVEGLVKILGEAGYSTVAEGIETPELLERVRDLQFDFAQGYHFGHPTRQPQGFPPLPSSHRPDISPV
ncbi:bifunctional diguanylate cyclase/phosphodiesterase [Thioalkalivibrio sp. ALJT]|uniref:putative bifunctional diguanylate cyclase/phosphodiesterase n=1 Tax=Thioalkalivibrio sp. ALJT TaxID=1158146 RepID=UPI000361B634|nr:bifunctional diguanylate cyclase/phosphodiesterase [Thioalkalivibrio sp. ALJT]